MMQPQKPSPPNASVDITPSQITISGAPLPGAVSPSALLRGFRAERQELANQLNDLQDTRTSLMRDLEQLPSGAAGRAGIEARIAGIDTRITAMDKAIADADAQVARAAAIPGAVIEQPPVERGVGMPEEVFVLSLLMIFLVLFPFSFAVARRIWKRGSTAVVSFPKEITERLARLEQSADATALEVERIGEGQRFLTRLFTESNAMAALPAAQAANEISERKGSA
jgi:hypothetical protein